MLTMRRLLREYRATGALNSVLAPWGFLDDEGTVITKGGDVGRLYHLAGADYECLDEPRRREVVHRCEAALRLLDESCRVYQYICKRRVQPLEPPHCRHPLAREVLARRTTWLNARGSDLYEVDLFLVVLYEGLVPRTGTTLRLQDVGRRPWQTVRQWLSASDTVRVLEDEITRAVGALDQRASAWEVQVADTVRPRRLPKADAYRFLRGLVNYAPHKAVGPPCRYDTHLDYFMADSSLTCHRAHLDLDGYAVKVLTMKEPPSATFPLVLKDLYAVPGEWIACLEWRRLPNDRMRRDLHARRRHFHNKRVSLANYVSTDTRPEEMLVDTSADSTVRQLGEALTELEVHGHFFGEASLSLALYDRDLGRVERATAEAIKVLASHDGAWLEESYNLLHAWLALVPGNRAHNRRRLALLETNVADLSFLFGLDRGVVRCPHLQREALAVFETQQQTPYHVALHVFDVGHAIVLGPTGSGKSFLLACLLMHAQRYDPLTVIFDIGHGYRKFSTLLHGSYLTLGLEHGGCTINPFALEPTAEHLHFLQAWVCVLLEGGDHYQLTDAEDREVYEAIVNLYVLGREQRRLFTLANVLPRALARRLARWIEGGRYAALFDHVTDTLDVQECQVFDFSAMQAFPELLEPLLGYVLHRVSSRIDDPRQAGRLKLCLLDEAWRFIKHPRLRAYVEAALKTWRKHNAAMLLASQSVDDFASADLLRTVVESCPTRWLLANAALDRARYADLFGLNETELDLLADLVPRGQVLLQRPTLTKVLNIRVDPHSYWIYTNSPLDNARFTAVVEAYGFPAALDHLAQG